jgi:hypothetical protein
VRYVDYKTLEENRRRYPELADEVMVNTDIIDDGFILRRIPADSLDFLVANHALEHSPNAYGTLRRWGSRLRRGGVLFVTIPIADAGYDRGRPITTLEHFFADDRAFEEGDIPALLRGTLEHIIEFMTISGHELCQRNGIPSSPWREIMRSAEGLMGELERQIETALRAVPLARSGVPDGTWGDQLVTCHVEYLNRVYDLHYHTFTLKSYYGMVCHFCKAEGFRLKDFCKNGAVECIAILRKA